MDVNWTYSKLTLTEDHLLSKHICLKVHLAARQCMRACVIQLKQRNFQKALSAYNPLLAVTAMPFIHSFIHSIILL